MANNRIVFEVVVTDNGTRKVVAKGIRDLGTEIDKTTKKQRAASGAGKDLNNTQEKGIIGTANATRSFSKLAETIGTSSGLVGAYATLAANIFAVSAAFNALRSASQVEQIFLGLEALGNRTGRALDQASKSVQELSGFTLSAEQAMRSTAQVISAGFDETALERITVAARDASFALGRPMQDSLDRLTRGIIKLEPELLDELGIMTRIDDATSAYAITIGKTAKELTAYERRLAFSNAALTEAELKFGGLAKAAGDSVNFDKLAATFQDLTKEIFNFANVIGKPLAGLLADNKILILGLGTLFASTISSQLLPGLAGLSDKAIEAANRTKETARLQKTVIAGEVAAIQSKSRLQIAEAKNFQTLSSGPKIYKANIDAVKAGTASDLERQKTLASLNRSLKAHQSQLADPKYNDSTLGNLKRGIIAETEKQIASINNLGTINERVSKQELESINRLGAARRAAQATSRVALAQETSGQAILLASQLKLRDSYALLGKAVQTYAGAQTLAGGGAMTMFGAIRTGAFAAAGAVKILSVAFLQLIPVIGQAVLVVGLLYSAYKWLRDKSLSENQKIYNKSLEEFNELLSKSSAYAKEYNRTLASAGPSSLKQVQSLTILSNSVNELSGKYNELRAAKDKIERDINLEQPMGQFEQLGAILSGIQTPNENSIKAWKQQFEEFDAFVKERPLPDFRIFGSDSITKDPAYKAIKDAYYSEIPLLAKVARQELQKEGGLAKLDLLPAAKKVEAFERAYEKMVSRLGSAGPAVTELQNVFAEAEKAANSFIRSSIINTQYDDMVTSLNSVSSALSDVRSSFKDAGLGSQELGDALSGIGSNFSQFLTIESQKAIKELKNQNSEMDALLAKGSRLTTDEAKRLESLKSSVPQAKIRVSLVDRELSTIRERFLILQEEERIGKAILALANARLSSVGSAFDKTGEGLRLQYAAEENIRSIQIQQIKAREEILKLIIATNKENLAGYKIELSKTINLIRQATAEVRSGTIDTEQERNEKMKFFVEKEREALGLLENIESTNNSIRDVQASITASALERQTITENALNSAQREARISERNVQLQNETLETIQKIKEIYDDIENTQDRMRVLSTGRVATLADEIKLLKTSEASQLAAQKTASQIRLNSLRSELRIAQADTNRAGGNSELLDNINQRISQEELLNRLTETRIKLLTDEQVLSKIIYDIRKEGNEWYIQAVNYQQKSLDVQKELSASLTEEKNLREDLEYRRSGIQRNAQSERAREINTAIEAYRLAVEEVSIKKDLITLEYALLEYERDTLSANLAERKAYFTQIGDLFQVQQLDGIINRLDSIDFNKIAESAKSVLDSGIRKAAINLEIVNQPSTSENNFFQSLIATMRGQKEISAARIAADVTLSTKRETQESKLIIANKEIHEKNTNQMLSLISSNAALAEEIKKLTTAIQTPGSNTVASSQNSISPISGRLTSRFGGQRNHSGIDIAASIGTDIIAPAAGEIKDIYRNAAGGLQVLIDHGQGVITGYAHLSDTLLRVGQRVEQGQVFAKSGNTGRSTGPHLHYTVSINNKKVDPEKGFQIPVSIINAENNKLLEDNSDILVRGQRSGSAIASDNSSVLTGQESMDIPAIPKFEIPPSISEALFVFEQLTASTRKALEDLGPEGAVVIGIMDGMSSITNSVTFALKTIEENSWNTKEGFANNFSAMAGVASAAIGTIQQITTSASEARIASVEREITAEQKRDGKSAESVAKIQALEKRKDEIAKKQFNLNKKLMMAQAVIATAAGIAQALTLGPIAGPILAGIIGALGAAQIAIIAGTSYQSSASSANTTPASPATLSIGKQGDSVNLARQNNNVGGELGYLRGSSGTGNNSSNFNVIGSAYGGRTPRGYGNTAFMVGEKGPEMVTPDTPMTVSPKGKDSNNSPLAVSFNIQALDSKGVSDLIVSQRGNIISMIREAANANGENFLETVDTNSYSRPNVSRL